MRTLSMSFNALAAALFRHRNALIWVGFSIVHAQLLIWVLTRSPLPYSVLDFLINNAGGPVRRGMGGDVAIFLASYAGATPAFWAWLILTLCTFFLTLLVIRLGRFLPENASALPFILGPAGILFFTYDIYASLRKEVVAYLAIAMVLSTISSQRPLRFYLITLAAGLVFLAALLLREGTLFLWPAFSLALAFASSGSSSGSSNGQKARKLWSALLAFGLLLVGLGLSWYYSTLALPDLQVMCEAARTPDCSGPVDFLHHSVSDAYRYVLSQHQPHDVAIFLWYFALAALPFACVEIERAWRGFAVLAVVVLTAATLPLFAIGFDWGRWIHAIVFPLNLLLITAIGQGFARISRPFPVWLTLAYVLLWNLPYAFSAYAPRGLYLLPVLGVLMSLTAGYRWLSPRR